MPTRIVEQREAELEARFENLQDETERQSDHPIVGEFESYFRDIRNSLDEITNRRRDVEANPDDTALYRRYLSKVLSTEADIEELEWVLTHVELYSSHQSLVTERVQRVEAICSELVDAFDLSATCLPVVRESYALLPLLDSEYYVIFVPRGTDLVPTTPILAHEVAHAILDQRSSRSGDFNERFLELRRRMNSDRTERDFHKNWTYWYDELFCDIAGFLAFGPSYVCAQLHHLLTRNPYHVERNVGIEDESLHPPDALRFEVVTEVADEHLPPELLDSLDSLRAEYEDHLHRNAGAKPSFYDDWVDEELIEAVIADAETVGGQLDQLCDFLVNDVDSSSTSDFEHRIEANKHWLEED